MTRCGTPTAHTVVFPCADAPWVRAIGTLPPTCPLSPEPNDPLESPDPLSRAERAMALGRVATAAAAFRAALANPPDQNATTSRRHALTGLGYAASLLALPDEAADCLAELRDAAEQDIAAATAAAFVEVWHQATVVSPQAGIEAAHQFADAARRAGALGGEMLLLHQAVRLGCPESSVRLAESCDSQVCRFTRLAAAHATALRERSGMSLATVASCFAAAGLRLEALDARAQAVAVLRSQGALTAAWEQFSEAHAMRIACEQPTSPAWREAKMRLPLSDAEMRTASLMAEGFTREAIARRLDVTPDDVDELTRAVYRKLRVSDRQALATIMSLV